MCNLKSDKSNLIHVWCHFPLGGWVRWLMIYKRTRVYISKLILLWKTASDAHINVTQGRPRPWESCPTDEDVPSPAASGMGVCLYGVKLEICMFMALDSIWSHIHNKHAGKTPCKTLKTTTATNLNMTWTLSHFKPLLLLGL